VIAGVGSVCGTRGGAFCAADTGAGWVGGAKVVRGAAGTVVIGAAGAVVGGAGAAL
jgi:hypothetical protein